MEGQREDGSVAPAGIFHLFNTPTRVTPNGNVVIAVGEINKTTRESEYSDNSKQGFGIYGRSLQCFSSPVSTISR